MAGSWGGPEVAGQGGVFLGWICSLWRWKIRKTLEGK